MLTIEADIESYLKKKVKDNGGKCIKLLATFSEGIPDRLVLLPGAQIAFVETKRPKGGKIAPLQRKWLNDLFELGFRACICNTQESIDVLIDDMVEAGSEAVARRNERSKRYE